jgi:protein TonB
MRTSVLSVPLVSMLLALSGCASAGNSSMPLRPVENQMAPRSAGVYDLSQVNQAPVARFQSRPNYPFELRRAGVSGEGVVSFIVDVDGTVRNAEIVRATDIRFGEAAAAAIVQWKFRPAQVNGAPVACYMTVPIVFTLNGQ